VIIDHIYQWAHIQPNRNAIIANNAVITYAEFAKGIEITRKFLECQQLPRGATIGLLMQNLLDCWIVCIASRAIGLNTVAVRNISEAQQLRVHKLWCFVDTEAEASNLVMPKDVDATIITVPKTIYGNIQQHGLPTPLETESLYGGHILYTSGTTGANKKLLWGARDEDRRISARANFHGYKNRTIFHNLNYPLWTGAGFKRPLSVWMSGGCVVFDQTDDIFLNFFRHKITNSLLLPSILSQLLAATCERRSEKSSEPITLDVGGSVLKRHQIMRALDQLSSNIIAEYSATELLTPPLMSTVHNEDDIEWLLPLDGRDVSVVTDEHVLTAPNVEGFLRVRLNDLDFTSYYDEVEGQSALVDGYFYPGDMAVKRADGRIRILGRVDAVLNVQGRKMAVQPIEQSIQGYFGVDEVCVFGHINDAGQEELIVAIESPTPPSEAKLDSVRKRFSTFDSVRFHVLNEFPRSNTGTGKIRRIVLKNLLTKNVPEG